MYIDAAYLNSVLHVASKEAVTYGLDKIVRRAKQRAPVRKMYRGGKLRPDAKVSGSNIGVLNLQSSSPSKWGVPGGTGWSYPNRVARVSYPSRMGVPTVGPKNTERYYGRPNSDRPVVNFPEVGKVTSGEDTNLRKIVNRVPVFQRVTMISGGRHRSMNLNRMVLSKAMFQISRGEGLFKNNLGEIQYGGTLRDSIHSSKVEDHPDEVVGYVDAKAMRGDFDYAIATEFGTAHNRPQPFMRPALRELRDEILTGAKSAFNRHLTQGRSNIKRHAIHSEGPSTIDLQVNVNLGSFTRAASAFDRAFKNQGVADYIKPRQGR